MTTAHRPTFDPARGKELPKGPSYHQRLLPAHTKLKVRQPGQDNEAERAARDLRAELLRAEAAHFAKVKGVPLPDDADTGAPSSSAAAAATLPSPGTKRALENGDAGTGEGGEDGEAVADGEGEDALAAKRRKILEETRDIDADSDGGSASESSDEDSEDDDDDDDEDEEDETAELLRELEKIKRERAEQREKEEAEKAKREQEQREFDIARGNPLLNKPSADFNVKRRWDDDVIFKNQARGTDDKNKKREFVNDLLRSDFHKKFMNKYVR